VEIYRSIMEGAVDALDAAKGRPGNFVNLQSSVIRFNVGGKKFLFGGDMQFVKPGTSDEVITAEVKRMRQVITDGTPYAFVKLCHHGSDNAFNEPFLTADVAGTKFLGICCGPESEVHPNKATLDVLRKHKNEITWLRTDKNGQCTFTFGQQTTTDKDHGKRNDLDPPEGKKKKDELPVEAGAVVAAAPPPPRAEPERIAAAAEAAAPIEITAKIPHVKTRVTITIDVEPGDARAAPSVVNVTPQRADLPRAAIGPVVASPAVRDLLIATNQTRLASNIGAQQTSQILDALRSAGAVVVDSLPSTGDAAAASAVVRQELKRRPSIKGVLILGGLDVVPSQRLDTLPAELRAKVGTNGDPDDFVVWNDETYGDLDADLIPELPVSRIPDGRDAALVATAIRAQANGGKTASGVRNIRRPFADGVFGSRLVPGGQMTTSSPNEFDSSDVKLAGNRLYLMLHGDHADGTKFWGEDTPRNREAINLSNIPNDPIGVVFTGCCWGGLTVDERASRTSPGGNVTPRTADNSIALALLRRGTNAFIGCTGAHYSPTEAPFDYFGGPMHDAFWAKINSGSGAAKALFDAKVEYVKKIPHRQRTPLSTAIEFKIWRQYCCLGLGW
jgi:hypothetical protein